MEVCGGCRFQDGRSVAVSSWDRLLPSCLNKLWWNSHSWEDGWQWICCKWKQTPKFLRIFFLPIFFATKLKTNAKSLAWNELWFLFSVISVFLFLFCDFCFVISVLWFLISVFWFLFSDFHFFFFCFLISVFRFQFSVFWFLFSSQWLWKKINVLMLAFVCRSLYIANENERLNFGVQTQNKDLC